MSCIISGKPVGRVGYGMISLLHPGRIATADAVEVLKAALDAGANLWNAAEYYGTAEYNSLHLLNAYFTKYPDDAQRVVVCVKSCIDARNAIVKVDAASVRESIERDLAILDGKCRIDVFQPGRLDRDIPIEETVGAIAEYVKAGKIGGIGLSECSGASIRKAAAVAPIAAVEVELSLFETGIFTNGVTDACREFNIPILAYCPLSRGFLTGQLRKYEDMAESDYRKVFPRFSKENFDNNVQLVDIAERVAKAKGCTVAQVAISWVSAQRETIGAPVIPIPGTISKDRLRENTADISLTEAELNEINAALEKVEVKGTRYFGKHNSLLSI